ncbi:hypothetical protein WA026_000623 [Henosepilachna vigintioctopunctata]|uniref:Uncharacterized protein n=1 Tax=Henosepilachna vigintioctopunctata TaxID=420089 RepID=A0AAW1V110_9CUCU
MDIWFKTQYKLTRRYQTLKIPKKLKILLSTTNNCDESSQLIFEEPIEIRFSNREDRQKCANNDEIKENPKLWRSLSLQNFKNRKQAKIEERKKPIIPSVLKTYDKGVKMGQSQQWL